MSTSPGHSRRNAQPWRLRGKQRARSKSPAADGHKQPCRKQLRRSSDFSRRKERNPPADQQPPHGAAPPAAGSAITTWLPTHLWQCKRMHMVDRWGYRVAWNPSDKVSALAPSLLAAR